MTFLKAHNQRGGISIALHEVSSCYKGMVLTFGANQRRLTVYVRSAQLDQQRFR